MDRLYDIGKKDFESVYDDLVDDFIREYREQHLSTGTDDLQKDAEEVPSDKDLKKAIHHAIK